MSTAENGEAVSEHPADSVAQDRSGIDSDTVERIAARTHRLLRERIRTALDEPVGADPAAQPSSDLTDEQLDQIANEEAQRAAEDPGRAVGALLQVALIQAVSEELGIELEDALEHPAVDVTRERLRPVTDPTPDEDVDEDEDEDDPAPRPRTPRQRALLLDAVHVFGIETLEPGDEDIELRLADAGIDVRKPSTAAMIGRLRWNEIRSVAVQRPRRGLPGRRRPALFVAGTDRGEVTFELPGLSDDEITEHLEPLIARNCASYSDSNAV